MNRRKRFSSDDASRNFPGDCDDYRAKPTPTRPGEIPVGAKTGRAAFRIWKTASKIKKF
jgi:hypothetical protein